MPFKLLLYQERFYDKNMHRGQYCISAMIRNRGITIFVFGILANLFNVCLENGYFGKHNINILKEHKMLHIKCYFSGSCGGACEATIQARLCGALVVSLLARSCWTNLVKQSRHLWFDDRLKIIKCYIDGKGCESSWISTLLVFTQAYFE